MDGGEDLLPFLKKSRKKGRGSSKKKQKAEAGVGKGANEAPFTINTLRDTDGKALVEDTAPPRPCILEALGSAASGGFIGALYGFGTKVIFFKGKGRLAAARGEAISTGKAFGSFGGLYALTSCIAKRLRNKDDLITTASAGAVTGFLIGIQGGLQGGLSCAAFTCAISVFIDKMQPEAATASQGLPLPLPSCKRSGLDGGKAENITAGVFSVPLFLEEGRTVRKEREREIIASYVTSV